MTWERAAWVAIILILFLAIAYYLRRIDKK